MSEPDLVTDPDDPLISELVECQWSWRIRHRYADEATGLAAARDLVRQLLAGSRLLRTGDGFVWLGPDGEFTPVYDVRAVSTERVPALRELATSVAAAPLSTSVLPGDPSREAFVADGTFRLTASTMRLDVTGPVPGEELTGRVEVQPMSNAEVAALPRQRS